MTTGFYSEAALAARTGLSRRTLQRFRVSGEGPQWIRLGTRRVAYRESDVQAWSEARTYPHRAAEMAAKAHK